MEVTEELNNCGQSGLTSGCISSLETTCHLVVCVCSQENWSGHLLVHEVLERTVTVLLERHVVLKTVADGSIDLEFEFQELLGEFHRCSKVRFVLDNGVATSLEVWVHIADDELQAVRALLKDLIHEFELVPFEVVEHPLAAGSFLRHNCFSLVGDQGFSHDFEHLWLCCGLEPEVGVLLFFGERLLSFLEVSETI